MTGARGAVAVVAASALLGSCGPSASREKVRSDQSLARILESDLGNPQLSKRLDARLDALAGDEAALASELAAAGFEPAPAPAPDCSSWSRTGPPERRLGRDHTLRIRIDRCGSNGSETRSLHVVFGDA